MRTTPPLRTCDKLGARTHFVPVVRIGRESHAPYGGYKLHYAWTRMHSILRVRQLYKHIPEIYELYSKLPTVPFITAAYSH
jgi:hypothetical protein